MKKSKLTGKQRKMVKKIMKENSIQRRVDDIVEKTMLANDIYKKESLQTKVDKIVSEELKKM